MPERNSAVEIPGDVRQRRGRCVGRLVNDPLAGTPEAEVVAGRHDIHYHRVADIEAGVVGPRRQVVPPVPGTGQARVL